MAFTSGRVSFCRFRVVGDAPLMVDDTVLGTLRDHAFAEAAVASPEQVETGFISGAHLFDTQFTFEANAYGNPAGSLLYYAMRIDTHAIPGEVKQAYQAIEEKAASTLNPSGFASKRQKRDARDVVDRKLAQEVSSGRFRRSKSVPVLWNLVSREIYLGATSIAAGEELAKLMHESFAVNLEMLTSGSLAEVVFSGNRRDFEDLKPSSFTPPPKDAREHEDEAGDAPPMDINVPHVPWVAASTSTRDFLGNEWLIWLWWKVETEGGVIEVPTITGGKKSDRKSRFAVVIDRSLDMDCAWDVTGKQSLRGGKPTLLPEAREALIEGKWPRKAGLIIADADDETQWELTLQGDKYLVSGCALPKVEDATHPREIVDQRLQSTLALSSALDGLYHSFLTERMSRGWATKVETIREWIRTRKRRR